MLSAVRGVLWMCSLNCAAFRHGACQHHQFPRDFGTACRFTAHVTLSTSSTSQHQHSRSGPLDCTYNYPSVSALILMMHPSTPIRCIATDETGLDVSAAVVQVTRHKSPGILTYIASSLPPSNRSALSGCFLAPSAGMKYSTTEQLVDDVPFPQSLLRNIALLLFADACKTLFPVLPFVRQVFTLGGKYHTILMALTGQLHPEHVHSLIVSILRDVFYESAPAYCSLLNHWGFDLGHDLSPLWLVD